MGTTAQLVTANQLLEMDDDGFRYDLIRGELDQMSPASSRHGNVAFTFGGLLFAHLRASRTGRAYGSETGFKLASNPDTVLGPDIAYVKYPRAEQQPDEGYFPGPPDLAVEVVSPSQSRPKILRKVAIYLAHGTGVVVVLHPKRLTASVHRSGAEAILLTQEATLDLSDVVPGFSVALTEVFA